jgi:hypothetical protein
MNPTNLSNPSAASKRHGVVVAKFFAILLKFYTYSLTSRAPPFLDFGTFKKSSVNELSMHGGVPLCLSYS